MSRFTSFIAAAKESPVKVQSLLEWLTDLSQSVELSDRPAKLLRTKKGDLHLSENGRASIAVAFKDGRSNTVTVSLALTKQLLEAENPMALLAESSVLETADKRFYVVRDVSESL